MWEEIRKIPGCRSDFAPGEYGEVLFLPVRDIDKLEPSFWMIGRYKDQTGLATALRSDDLLQTYGDREENVKQYWATQTPQSHHIVEFNHLRDIGASAKNGAGEMDHAQLPCMLLIAEFHQRYISSILKNTHGRSASQLRGSLTKVYFSMYGRRGPLFEPLWTVSQIILRSAGVSLAGHG